MTIVQMIPGILIKEEKKGWAKRKTSGVNGFLCPKWTIRTCSSST